MRVLFAAVRCRFLAQSRHGLVHCKCPLSEVKRTLCRPRALRFSSLTVQKIAFGARERR